MPPPSESVRRILVVDDDEPRRRLFVKILTLEGYLVDELPDGSNLLRHVAACPPDLILLDVMLPGVSGFELCGDLRMMDEMRLTPIILVTSACAEEESVVRGLLCGADDYVATPARLAELRARIRVQLRNRRDRELLQWARQLGAEMRNAAMRDPLTGLANRRAVDAAIDRALEGEQSAMVLMLDVDHFKKVNDTYGHAVGDRVLIEIAAMLGTKSRACDLPGRYGGEEFVVLVQGAPLAAAEAIGERYRRAVRDIEFPADLGPGSVSASIGVAAWAPGVRRPNRLQLLAQADRALYAAKRGGRDRVVVHTSTSLPPPELTLGDKVAR